MIDVRTMVEYQHILQKTRLQELGQTIPNYHFEIVGRKNRTDAKDLILLSGGLQAISLISYQQQQSLPRDNNFEMTKQISDLLTAIIHYHSISQFDGEIAIEEKLIKWENNMQYIYDIPEDIFWGNQRRSARVAKTAAEKASRQRQYINSYLHSLEKYIYFLESKLYVHLEKNQGTENGGPSKNISLKTSEEIDVRRRLSPIIFHDMSGAISTLQLWQELGSLTNDRDMDMLKRGAIHAWKNLFETAIHMDNLIQDPYSRASKPTEYWQNEIERAAESLSKKYLTLEVRCNSSPAPGEIIWSREWLRSLIDNIGQNIVRIWPDAVAKGLDQTKGMYAHPVLGIQTESNEEAFVISFHDNGTGFSEEYLSHGFSGQHNYRSHGNSTGTAMKTLSHMIHVYGGEIVLANRYKRKDGTTFESPDPRCLDDSSLESLGSVIKVKFRLQ